MTEEDDVSDLRHSSEIIGKLYPILLDADGNIIDGKHRLAADSKWPAVRLFHIRSEKEHLLARLISNSCWRTVSAEEKRGMLERLGKICLAEGERRGRLARAALISESYVMNDYSLRNPEPLPNKPLVGFPGGAQSNYWLQTCFEKLYAEARPPLI